MINLFYVNQTCTYIVIGKMQCYVTFVDFLFDYNTLCTSTYKSIFFSNYKAYIIILLKTYDSNNNNNIIFLKPRRFSHLKNPLHIIATHKILYHYYLAFLSCDNKVTRIQYYQPKTISNHTRSSPPQQISRRHNIISPHTGHLFENGNVGFRSTRR